MIPAALTSILGKDANISSILKGATKFIGNAFTKTTDSEGMLKNWRGDADGGLAEVVRWTKQNGDYPLEEAKAVKTLLGERGLENVIGKQTRYGDVLKLDDVIKKFAANGFSDEADALRQYQRQQLSGQTLQSTYNEILEPSVITTPITSNSSFFDSLQSAIGIQKPVLSAVTTPRTGKPNGNPTTAKPITKLTDTAPTKNAGLNIIVTVLMFVPAAIAFIVTYAKKGSYRRR